jgi:hypothetical protein
VVLERLVEKVAERHLGRLTEDHMTAANEVLLQRYKTTTKMVKYSKTTSSTPSANSEMK